MAKYKAILIMSVCGVILYGANYFILQQLPQYIQNPYEIATYYCFFWVCAAIVLFAVYKVHAKSPDNTGYVFMGATLVQMGLSYLMLRPILNSLASNAGIEKKNFFAIFILFLAIETVITIRLLNNKQ